MMGKGVLYSKSSKQKINVKSSTEAELVGASDFLPQTIWTRCFIESQGYTVDDSVFFQDNMSAMKMERNGTVALLQANDHDTSIFDTSSSRIALQLATSISYTVQRQLWSRTTSQNLYRGHSSQNSATL
jgi:hypothetical protein